MERIEFKTFTKFSKNSIVDYKDLINYAKELGQKAIAITDYNSIEVFPKIEKYIKETDFKVIYGTVVEMLENDFLIPVTIIVRTQNGLKNLYKIISRLKTDNLEEYGKQVVTRADLNELSDGLLYGLDVLEMQSIYDNQTDEQVCLDMLWYDFIEVRALEGYEEYTKRIINLALDIRKIIIATGNVCYLKSLEKEDYEVLFPKEVKNQDRYLKSTNEMLEKFKFLNDDKLILDIVVNNTNKLANLVDDIKINSNKTYLPRLNNSKNILLDMVYSKAYEKYGNPLPEIIQKRLNEELYGKDSTNKNGIINLKYESIFLINQKLVEYSHSLGYPVCTRGNIASSLVAYFIGISNINPLPPHYYCSNCGKTIFIDEDICGLDLPNKKCSKCNEFMKKDGFNISLCENINKFLNISINYSIEIENKLDEYLIDMFGKDKVYRAGVVAIKEEFEAQKILDEIIKDNQLKITDERKKKLLGELVGTFKTIGQNPGGRFIIPKEKSIYDFTPITYPCDNKKYNKVTYFDYHDLNKTLLKINILFHDSVSILKGIEDITGINSNKISFDDKETMELIQSGNTDNIFEFKTETVKKMILKEKPTNIQELINIVIKAHSNKYYTLSKAHASSYVVLAYKLAWFKVHYPKGFKMISSKYE